MLQLAIMKTVFATFSCKTET